MKIFFNGDSHTSGSELYFPTQDAYPYQLAKLLDGEIVGNPAVGGASNDRILRTTEEYLRDCERTNEYPDLIVIGWSEPTRLDWFVNGKYESLYSEDFPPVESHKVNDTRATHFSQDWRHTSIEYVMTQYHHEKIFNLHQHLEYLKIPHLFFNAVNSFNTLIEKNKPFAGDLHNYEFFKHEWNDCFWNPYEDEDGSFRTWGLKKGYAETKWYHLSEDAHADFAQTLYQYINSKIF
jgi:hypothetical protein